MKTIDWRNVAIGLIAGIVLASPPVARGDSLGAVHSDSIILVRHEDAPQPQSPQRQASEVLINGRAVTPQEVQQLQTMYGVTLPPGRYWYDSISGLLGIWGRESAGFLRPGHDFGKVPANASEGDTGVFINGRQLNRLEAVYFMQVFGPAFGMISAQTTGRWWFDGRTGNVGLEGHPVPVANLFLAIQQQLQQGQMGGRPGGGSGGGASYRYNSLNGQGAIEGRCVTFNGGSAGVFMSGCE